LKKTIETVLSERTDMELWENGIIDWLLNPEGTFSDHASKCICPLCNTKVMHGMDKYLAHLNPNTKGIQHKCPGCSQIYFIHQYVPMFSPGEKISGDNWENILNLKKKY